MVTLIYVCREGMLVSSMHGSIGIVKPAIVFAVQATASDDYTQRSHMRCGNRELCFGLNPVVVEILNTPICAVFVLFSVH